MEPLRILQDLITKVDYSHVSKHDHREIYQYINKAVLSPKSPIIKQVPTLDAIAYSIRGILSPHLSTRHIPNLLDLLATVEFYRKRTLDHARGAIIWNDYYKIDKTLLTLSNEEETFLRSLESQRSALREMYITLLTTCCHLDMYLLWTAVPFSMTDFLIRFNEYFPFLNDQCNRESPRLFHSDLSNKEITQLEAVGLNCCDLAQETVEWANEYVGEGQTLHSAFGTENFREIFPRPCEDEKLSHLVTFFTNYVLSAAKGVEKIFGQGDS